MIPSLSSCLTNPPEEYKINILYPTLEKCLSVDTFKPSENTLLLTELESKCVSESEFGS